MRRKPRELADHGTPELAVRVDLIDRPTSVAGLTGKLVQAPIDRLMSRGHISRRQHSAAIRLRDDYELGICQARPPDGESPPGIRPAFGPRGIPETVVIAAGEFRRAVQAIGKRQSFVICAIVCQEHTLDWLARKMGSSPHGVAGALRMALDSLADHYRLTGD